VSFEDVWFRYPLSTGEPALQGVRFTLEPGQTLGVIGPTGSGKSALAALLLRFYQPTQGRVLLDGEDVATMPADALLRRVSIVPQSPALFTGTIAENLRWGDWEAGDAALEAAARAAQADQFIRETTEGYDTPLGQHGVNLSGGQKQRLSIARALLREPGVLILDDCTSALDALTEAATLRAIREAAASMTCVLISQRVTTVLRADKILVLEDGRQAGCGGHAELLQSCPVYRDIYASQMGEGALGIGVNREARVHA
jgi:ATP-binding cassette subfamily B protein